MMRWPNTVGSHQASLFLYRIIGPATTFFWPV